MEEAGELSALFDRLFPICRSICGPGIRESLQLLAKEMPLRISGILTGTRVFDWKVPPEWHIRAATLCGPDGTLYADFARSNLCVLNFSEPVDIELDREELLSHLHYIPELPGATPYVTSYYRRRWGFCLPHELVCSLPPGRYRARIDSEFRDGELNYAEAVLPGDSDREFLLTSYLCHPSLANNELSGPLVMLSLYRRLSAWKRRRFTYRFVLGPETIGSIAYLSVMGEHLRRHMVGGMVLTCLGGPASELSYKTSKRQNTLLDQVVEYMNERGEIAVRIRAFTPTTGSDERQYCSAGFNLPMGQMARTVYGEYAGYHNSLDDKEFMGIAALIQSADQIERLLAGFEEAGTFTNLCPFGEPQLGRRDLYPTLNSHANREKSCDSLADQREMLNQMLTILSYSDGEHTMLSIARRLGCSLRDLAPRIARLEQQQLLLHRPDA
jgi:aminopeptidase-like protein